jgi:hypothetical protein
VRLSEWKGLAPNRLAMDGKVMAVVKPVLGSLGAEEDPLAWVSWGDDPTVRYSVMAPTPAGLITCHVRVNVPGEGPRAAGKVTRWPRVQIGELAVEMQAGHRIVSTQVEGVVMTGVDADADRIAAFVLALYAAIDGRLAAEPRRRTAAAGRGVAAPGRASAATSARATRPTGARSSRAARGGG